MMARRMLLSSFVTAVVLAPMTIGIASYTPTPAAAQAPITLKMQAAYYLKAVAPQWELA
jgi:hypothetical protein